MRPSCALFASIAVPFAVGISCVGCGANSANPASSGEPDAAADDEGGTSDDAEAGPTGTYVRIAHLSPDAPALDVCLAPHGTAHYEGPVFTQFAVDAGLATDASAPGLSYGQVSTYFAFDPGRYDVRVVSAGSTSCGSPLTGTTATSASAGAGDDADANGNADSGANGDAGADADADAGADSDADSDANGDSGADSGADSDANGDAGADANGSADAGGSAEFVISDTTSLPTFAMGAYETILIVGDATPAGTDAPFRLSAVRDDAALTGGAASVRAINALPSVPSADFGFGSSAGPWVPLFANVAFGDADVRPAPNQGTTDPNGYLTIAPFGPQQVSVRASTGEGGDIASANASVSAGAVVTMVAVGGKTGDLTHPPALLTCTDDAPSGGLLADCALYH